MTPDIDGRRCPPCGPTVGQWTVSAASDGTVADFLSSRSGLSKSRVKEAMVKGAAWLRRGNAGRRRIRRATARCVAGDRLWLYYDAQILSLTPVPASMISDRHRYSVWLKPAGLLSQGTNWGDHCSLLRQVETADRPRRPVYLIHRLDREAAGIMVMAHDRRCAASLSHQFKARGVVKRYRAVVAGNPREPEGECRLALDGKPALTAYRRLAYDLETDSALMEVVLETGRKHQIRRHLSALGMPVVGDRRYGKPPHDRPLALWAVSLAFTCPVEKRPRTFSWCPPEAKRDHWRAPTGNRG